MNAYWILAFVVAPLTVLTLGWAAVFWHEHRLRRHRDHPAE